MANKAKGITGSAVKAVVQAVASLTVKARLLQVASMLPTATIGQQANPFAAPQQGNKRAAALAAYLVACQLLHGKAQTNCPYASKLAGIALVFMGAGYNHSTGTATVGEIKASGLTGYIKPGATWWQALAKAGSASKATSYNGLASAVYAAYANSGKAASPNGTNAQAIYAHLQAGFIASLPTPAPATSPMPTASN